MRSTDIISSLPDAAKFMSPSLPVDASHEVVNFAKGLRLVTPKADGFRRWVVYESDSPMGASSLKIIDPRNKGRWCGEVNTTTTQNIHNRLRHAVSIKSLILDTECVTIKEVTSEHAKKQVCFLVFDVLFLSTHTWTLSPVNAVLRDSSKLSIEMEPMYTSWLNSILDVTRSNHSKRFNKKEMDIEVGGLPAVCRILIAAALFNETEAYNRILSSWLEFMPEKTLPPANSQALVKFPVGDNIGVQNLDIIQLKVYNIMLGRHTIAAAPHDPTHGHVFGTLKPCSRKTCRGCGSPGTAWETCPFVLWPCPLSATNQKSLQRPTIAIAIDGFICLHPLGCLTSGRRIVYMDRFGMAKYWQTVVKTTQGNNEACITAVKIKMHPTVDLEIMYQKSRGGDAWVVAASDTDDKSYKVIATKEQRANFVAGNIIECVFDNKDSQSVSMIRPRNDKQKSNHPTTINQVIEATNVLHSHGGVDGIMQIISQPGYGKFFATASYGDKRQRYSPYK
jgi:hypothetical protein